MMIPLLVLYYLAVFGMALFGLYGVLTLYLYLRHRHTTDPIPVPIPDHKLPLVTVQLPIYNESKVIGRLIDAAASIDYPRDRLEIQVLDDSNDDSSAIVDELVAKWSNLGVNIRRILRVGREGYKAGALENGLSQAGGDFIAVFDADFVPRPDVLTKVMRHFAADPNLGMVQTRWSHLNAEYSLLTRAQAIALDKHFAVDQFIRDRQVLFPKFNGSAGVWRRSCIEESGGWSADTLCEDLDLSTRAQLQEWRFLYLNESDNPAELPPTVGGYKTQQARWAVGSLQCAWKYGRSILSSPNHTLLARVFAVSTMLGYVAHPLILLIILILPFLLLTEYRFSPWLSAIGVLGATQPILLVLSQQERYENWISKIARGLPALALLAIGIAPSNTRSLIKSVFLRDLPFVRTPKFNLGPDISERSLPHVPSPVFDPILLVETVFFIYSIFGALVAWNQNVIGSIPFFLFCSVSFAYTAWLSARESVARKSPRIIFTPR